jgi:hypothetical protein
MLHKKKTFAQRRASHQRERMTGEMGDVAESKSLGQMDANVGERNCSESACDCAAVTSLDQQAFCLNHFLSRCYSELETVDPRGQKVRENPVELASMRAFIEECSRKALDVSLQSQDLTNLERGRLLDILLWAGELFLLLRAPRITFSEPETAVDLGGATRAASRRS